MADTKKIVIDGKRAVGVQYQDGDRQVTLRANREVLLSAGALQSPQLLMLSGIGPADHLKERGIEVVHDAPEVGENLQDHLNVHYVQACPGTAVCKFGLQDSLGLGMEQIQFLETLMLYCLLSDSPRIAASERASPRLSTSITTSRPGRSDTMR